jgi:BirA family biotin operon repressor/biotin-[acetyl-CoA-carboxylase] ligase
MSTRYRLIALLADGRFHSGHSLGERMGISRSAVWKQVQTLSELGLDVHAVRGQGYRLKGAITLLDLAKIRGAMAPPVLARLSHIDVFQDIDSTNTWLKQADLLRGSNQARLCIAEYQRAGRGRRGRRWISPYGSNLYLSLAIEVTEAALAGGGLSLAAAIAVTRSLQSCGICDLGLKWPNDILYQGRKLAGILLDLSGESGGPYRVNIGAGINLSLSASAASEIDQPWADLSQSGVDIDRNRLAALITENLIEAMDVFNENGLDAFALDWQNLDLVSGRTIELQRESEPMVRGIARGIDRRGALLIEHNGITRSYHAGEVSIRLAS